MEGLTYVAESGRDYDSRDFHELSRILGIEVTGEESVFKRIENFSLENLSTLRVRNAYQKFGGPCIVEESAVTVRGEEIYSGGKFKVPREFQNRFFGQEGLARIALAYTLDGNEVHIFQGDIPGTFVNGLSESGTWWDTMWVPRGYQKTMKELTDLPHILDKRTLQYLKLAEYLKLPGSRDVYEAHVTVDCNGVEDWQRFSEVCNDIGIKGIQIQLPKGDYPTHLITASWHKGPFERVKEEVFEVGNLLDERGFRPTRHKMEAMLTNTQVPILDSEAKSRPREQYFEFHVKVEENDLDSLREICDKHGAHLSRTASNRSGNIQQRFITARYRVGLENANALFDSMLLDLSHSGFKLSNRLREYTVFDDNLEQDRGWADESACVSCDEYNSCPLTDIRTH